MSDSTYSTAMMSSFTGFSVRQLDYWSKVGLVVPSIQQAQGPGTRKRYAPDDILPLLLIRKLKDQGWSTQKIRQAVSVMRRILQDENPLQRAILVDGKGTILALYKTKNDEQVVLDTLSINGQHVLSIVLEVLQEETKQAANLLNHTLEISNKVHK
jgi:DNA-binding transcriptional MerR regulator